MTIESLRIDQAGLALGTAGRSRDDGLGADVGGGLAATVTLTDTDPQTTSTWELLSVAPGDDVAVGSLAPSGHTCTFTPKAGVAGSYRIQLTQDAGLATEEIEIRTFGIRTENLGLRIPAHNEKADPDATIATAASMVSESETNAPTDDYPGGSPQGWHPSEVELYQAVDLGVRVQEAGVASGARPTLNFIGATAADNPAQKRVDITIDAASPLSDAAPTTIQPDASASAGVSSEASRGDHRHAIVAAAPSATGVATASAEGVATSFARSDHAHQSNTAPVDVTKAAAAIGTSGEPARADHKHDVSTAAPGAIAIGDSALEGSATSLARSDHRHSLAAPAAPAQLGAGTSATGASTAPARADHEHRPRVTIGAVAVLDIDTDGQVTVKGGTGGAGLPGEPVAITAGAGGTGNTAGADLTLEAGTKSGSGLAGRIYLGASTARQIIAGSSATTLVQVQSDALSLIPPGGTEGTRDVATFLSVAPASAVAAFTVGAVEGDPNGQLAAAPKGSLVLDLTNVELYQKTADSPSTAWKSSRRSPRTARIIVGNEDAGDAAADCDYLDTGNGAQLAAAIAAAVTGDGADLQWDVYIRPGLYDLGAASGPSTPITVGHNVRVRGAYDNYDGVRIKAKGGANDQGIFLLQGSGDANEQLLEHIYFEVPASATGTGSTAVIRVAQEESGVRIRDCRFVVGVHASGALRYGILVDETNGAVVRTVLANLRINMGARGVYTGGAASMGIRVLASTTNPDQDYSILDCEVSGADVGIATDASGVIRNFVYRQNLGYASMGIWVNPTGEVMEGLRIEGGRIQLSDYQDSRGVLFAEAGTRGATIRGVHFAGLGETNDGTAIALMAGEHVAVEACVIDNATVGVHIENGVDYVSVVGCSIDATTPIDDDTADGIHAEHNTGPNLVEHLPRSIHLSSPAAPTGLYTLDNSLADSSGNGRTTLALAGGATNRYCQGARPNKRAWRALVTAYGDGLQLTSGNSTWAQLTGAMSAICRVNPITDVRATVDQVNRVIMECGASDAAGGANNTAWRMMFGYSASVIVEWYSGATPTQRRFETTELCQAVGRGYALGFTRSSGGVVKVYRDGELIGTSGALTMPDGVTNARFCVGVSMSHAGYAYGGCDISDVAVYTSELTGADMQRISRRLLGEHNAKESI